MVKTVETLDTRFTRADDTPKHRIIWAGYGEAGSGKTTFGLGAPGPIFIQSLDQGLEGVVEPFTQEKEIFVKEYVWAPAPGAELLQTDAQDLREQFIADFEYALPRVRTILWDKESDVFSLFTYAEHGFSEQGSPKNWDGLKNRLRRLISLVKETDINFGLLQGMRNEWVAGPVNPNTGKKGMQQTGKRIRSGMDEIAGLVHLDLFHERVKTAGESLFQFSVGKSRGPGSKTVQDQTFENVSFSDFAQLVFPDSTEEDWV